MARVFSQGLFHRCDSVQQLTDLLFDRIRHPIMVEQSTMVDWLALVADQFSGNTDHSSVVRHLMQDDGIGSDHGIVTNPEGAEQFGSCSDQDIVAQRRVALAFVFASSTQCDAMVNRAIVTDLSCFADDNPHAVVNEQTFADLGPGMDFDSGPEATVWEIQRAM